ncbi:Leucine-rich repeat-containing protein 4B-like protein [Leptotrombidium deliense]|uniref:Leucine-rich repeat-containing protein 4B-like protein n=1 Tax=Leptotrombidium deliense TaxID=299467 RepID=A0A443SG77_9ACAR|nr:Leucine-rich repeat-containing protein 4B-like protein [Leptotrombidium deliense]
MKCRLSCTDSRYEVCTFDCSSLDLRDIVAEEIPHSPNIRTLTFTGNRLQSLSKQYFLHNNRYTNVDFSHNNIEYIESETFAAFNETTHLSLSYNQIWDIRSDVFQGLTNLLQLDLSYNRLSIWSSMCMQPLKRLTELNLAHNAITSLDADSFIELQSLTRLTLDYNELSELSADQFSSNARLKYLSLKGNTFTVVPNIALQSARNLLDLDLSATKLSKIKEKHFASLSSIQTLRLNRIQSLTEIEKLAFADMFNLRTFYCNNNDYLKRIDSTAFVNSSDNNKLQRLRLNAIYVRNSMITTFGEDLLDWRTLKTIDLSGNPFTCDCNLRWIRNLSNIDANVVKSMRCQKPWKVSEKRLFDLSEDQFVCTFMSRIDNEIIAACLLIIVVSMLIVIIAYICVRLSLLSKIFKRRKSGNEYVRVFPKKDRIELEWDYNG